MADNQASKQSENTNVKEAEVSDSITLSGEEKSLEEFMKDDRELVIAKHIFC